MSEFQFERTCQQDNRHSFLSRHRLQEWPVLCIGVLLYLPFCQWPEFSPRQSPAASWLGTRRTFRCELSHIGPAAWDDYVGGGTSRQSTRKNWGKMNPMNASSKKAWGGNRETNGECFVLCAPTCSFNFWPAGLKSSPADSWAVERNKRHCEQELCASLAALVSRYFRYKNRFICIWYRLSNTGFLLLFQSV